MRTTNHHGVSSRTPAPTRPRAAARALLLACLAVMILPLAFPATVFARRGDLELNVVDQDTGRPLAVRMHLKNQRGRSIFPRGAVRWKDHFVFPGRIEMNLPTGAYTFELERGPEYRVRRGNFVIRSGAKDSKRVEMVRFVDMKKEGWYSGELHVHRPLDDIKLLMLAEDLHVAPVITWWNQKNLWADRSLPEKTVERFDLNRYYSLMAGEDEREGGALLYFHLPKPLPITEAEREFPSPVRFLEMAKESHPNCHVDLEKPFWWDTPTWVATGQIDSIGLAHNHMHRDGVLDSEAWGKPRDKTTYPGAQGNGRWTTHIYYQLLNAGLRIPPSAGSASGVLPNPVGYNRAYVHIDGEFSYDKWFEGLRSGRVVVTNGPILRPKVNGELPGHVFTAGQGESVELSIQLNLALREKVEYLEVVRDGKVIHEVRLSDYAKAGGRLPNVTFEQSGWLLIRAVTNNSDTYRFASTGPYYVEIDQRPRVSRSAAQFFVDWVKERIERIKLDDPAKQSAVIAPHQAALEFWQRKVDNATAD